MVGMKTSQATARFSFWAVIGLAAAVGLGAGGNAGCGMAGARGSLMTPQEVAAHGTMVVPGDVPHAYHASVDALRALGYEIAVERPERGLVISGRQPLGSVARVSGGSYSATGSSVTYYRQFTIQVDEQPGGNVRVVATPAVFEGNADISSGEVWALEGPQGERAKWDELFQNIRRLM
jgi:hypothetical protein